MKQQFDDQVKNAFDSNNYPMDKANWEQMAAIIDAQKPDRKRRFLWLLLLLIPLGIGGYFLVDVARKSNVQLANDVPITKNQTNNKAPNKGTSITKEIITTTEKQTLNNSSANESKNKVEAKRGIKVQNDKLEEPKQNDKVNEQGKKTATATSSKVKRNEVVNNKVKRSAEKNTKPSHNKVHNFNTNTNWQMPNADLGLSIGLSNAKSQNFLINEQKAVKQPAKTNISTQTSSANQNRAQDESAIFIDPIGLKLISNYPFNQTMLQSKAIENDTKLKPSVSKSYWSVTPQLGLSFGNWIVNAADAIADTLETLYTNEGQRGYQIGANVKYHFGKNFLMGAGLFYATNKYNYNHSFYNVDSTTNIVYAYQQDTTVVNNYRISRASVFTVMVDTVIVEDSTAIVNYTLVNQPIKQRPLRINQISMPIFIGIETSLSDKWNAQLFTGAVLNYVVKSEGILPNENLQVYNNGWAASTKTFSVDYAIHASINRKLGENGALSFNPSYIMALQNDNKNYHIRTKSNKIWFNLGYQFNF